MVNPFITKFLADVELEDKSNYTIINYRNDLNLFSSWLNTEKRQQLHPNNFTYKTLHEYMSYVINEEKAKPSTINRKLATLSRFSKWCLENEYIKSDPTTQIRSDRKTQMAPNRER